MAAAFEGVEDLFDCEISIYILIEERGVSYIGQIGRLGPAMFNVRNNVS